MDNINRRLGKAEQKLIQKGDLENGPINTYEQMLWRIRNGIKISSEDADTPYMRKVGRLRKKDES